MNGIVRDKQSTKTTLSSFARSPRQVNINKHKRNGYIRLTRTARSVDAWLHWASVAFVAVSRGGNNKNRLAPRKNRFHGRQWIRRGRTAKKEHEEKRLVRAWNIVRSIDDVIPRSSRTIFSRAAWSKAFAKKYIYRIYIYTEGRTVKEERVTSNK